MKAWSIDEGKIKEYKRLIRKLRLMKEGQANAKADSKKTDSNK